MTKQQVRQFQLPQEVLKSTTGSSFFREMSKRKGAFSI